MSTKIDLRLVFGEHFKTMRDAKNNKISRTDIALFFVFPVALGATIMTVSKGGFDAQSAGIWVGALSILAGLMVNVLVLLYAIRVVGPSKDEKKSQVELIKEVNVNIIFSVLVSIACIILLCIVPLFDGVPEKIMSGVIIALLANFTLTLLMTLKRLKALVDLRFKSGVDPSA